MAVGFVIACSVIGVVAVGVGQRRELHVRAVAVPSTYSRSSLWWRFDQGVQHCALYSST
jgi:hypothetical protein